MANLSEIPSIETACQKNPKNPSVSGSLAGDQFGPHLPTTLSERSLEAIKTLCKVSSEVEFALPALGESPESVHPGYICMYEVYSPDEMENLLGFQRNHIRGGGMSWTERYKSLRNSFQVHTVTYHLSVLKPVFPNRMNVLSFFTGIGGGEVALHGLKISMKVVVSVEISESNRNILKDFLKQTKQKGVLVEFSDVQVLSNDKIESLMERFGGFDLVIGGSQCNNLAGGNRVS